MADAHTLTISQAHEKLKNKELSCEELVRACLDRIDAVDGKLNAVVFNNGEEALKKAKEIDAKGDFSHPLTGIPYLAKDVYCEKGVPTTACSNILRGELTCHPEQKKNVILSACPTVRRGAQASDKDAQRADEGSRHPGKTYCPPFDSTTTKRLNAVGAISLGKANTDEFTMGSSSETSCYGVTRNPWDTSRVAGGSSGGSAAGVAANECIFALGTDTCGSIRLPAGYCGCTGMRVTYGRTSRYGVMSMASSLDTIGPLCKNIEDLAIVTQAIAGKDPHDATTSDRPVPDYVAALSGEIKGMKIGLPSEYFVDASTGLSTGGLDPETEKAVKEAVKTLKSLGAEIIDISLPHTKYAIATYYILCPSEVSSNMARYDGIRYGHSTKDAKNLIDYYEIVRSEGFGDEVKRRIMIGTYALSAGYYDAYYRKAQKVRTLIKQDFDNAFKNVDVILSPVTPTTAFTIGSHEGDPLSMYLEDIFMGAQVLAGIPALSVPCGFSKDNLPIGLQIMGPQWGEAMILNAAFAFEKAFDEGGRKPVL